MRLRDGLWATGVFLLAMLAMVAPVGRPVQPWLTVATAVWAAALVLISRRWPGWAMLLTTPLYATSNLLAIAPTALVIFRTARSPRRLWVLVTGTAALQLGFSGLRARMEGTSLAEYLGGSAFTISFLLLFPAVAGALIGRRKPLTQVLLERNDYLEQARALTASTTRAETRAHIATEMHDMLSHRLSLLAVHAGALEHAAAQQAPELREQVELIRKTSAVALDELREILGVLGTRPDTDEDAGTRADVERLVAASVAAGISVQLAWSGADLTGADARVLRALHRVVREGLTNVHKHAPSARTRVLVDVGQHWVQVAVVNSPSGEARGAGTRRGLVGLEERVGLIGGSFIAGVVPGVGGFRLAASLPLHPVQEEPAGSSAVAEAPPPIAAEVLTTPRVVGSGCLGMLAVVPVFGTLLVLIVVAVFGRSEMSRQDFDSLQVSVVREDDLTNRFGHGLPAESGCYRYYVLDEDGDVELCFSGEGVLVSKRELQR